MHTVPCWLHWVVFQFMGNIIVHWHSESILLCLNDKKQIYSLRCNSIFTRVQDMFLLCLSIYYDWLQRNKEDSVLWYKHSTFASSGGGERKAIPWAVLYMLRASCFSTRVYCVRTQLRPITIGKFKYGLKSCYCCNTFFDAKNCASAYTHRLLSTSLLPLSLIKKVYGITRLLAIPGDLQLWLREIINLYQKG